eukprot:6911337-Pyramimonas_sp.AAC.1
MRLAAGGSKLAAADFQYRRIVFVVAAAGRRRGRKPCEGPEGLSGGPKLSGSAERRSLDDMGKSKAAGGAKALRGSRGALRRSQSERVCGEAQPRRYRKTQSNGGGRKPYVGPKGLSEGPRASPGPHMAPMGTPGGGRVGVGRR